MFKDKLGFINYLDEKKVFGSSYYFKVAGDLSNLTQLRFRFVDKQGIKLVYKNQTIPVELDIKVGVAQVKNKISSSLGKNTSC